MRRLIFENLKCKITKNSEFKLNLVNLITLKNPIWIAELCVLKLYLRSKLINRHVYDFYTSAMGLKPYRHETKIALYSWLDALKYAPFNCHVLMPTQYIRLMQSI